MTHFGHTLPFRFSGQTTLLSFSLLILSLKGFSLAVYDSVWTNSDTVGKYNKFEISVVMTAQYLNPFDYNQVNLKGHFTSPSGDIYQVDGFYYQDYLLNPPDGDLIPNGEPYWKIRFSPDETGTWTYMLVCKDATGTAYSGTYPFECDNSSNPGFVSTTDTYFQKFSNGTPFFSIGMSIPWNIFEGGFYIYEQWMDSLAANEANFIKIIMAPWSFGIEWNNTGLGNYTNRLDIAFWLDWVLNKAETDGLYLQLCPLIHNEVSTLSSNEWAWSPYKASNGGPCEHTWDFYTNATAIRFYKQKLRYIQSRWGYSPYLSAWELFTETDNTGDFDDYRNQINNWLNMTGLFLDSLDIHHRPISPSYASLDNDPVMWENDMVDFTQIHLYRTTPDLELALHAGTRHYLSKWDKPNIIGEFGLGHDPSEIITLDPNGISFHNSLWATAFSGAFGTATAWHWDSYIHTQHLYHHFKPVSTFMQTIDLLEKDYHPVSVFSTSDNNLDAEIYPGYKVLFSPAPEDEFTVETTGDLVPRNSYLSFMLYGFLFNNSKNPPHFYVNYTKPGQFKVRTGNDVLLSTLKIWIDGVKVLDQTAHNHTTYTVNVAAGSHMIFVENSGSFYIEIEKYIFTNYAPVCRSFALKDPSQVCGWVQNRNYNWQYINQSGQPPPLGGGQMNFTGLDDSYYAVEWFSGSTGLYDSSVTVATSSGQITVDVPGILWDAAYKINYLDHSIQATISASETDICEGETVTFTNTSTGIVTGQLWQFPGGIPSTSSLPAPQVVYSESGTYDVILKVYNAFDTIVLTDTAMIRVRAVPQIMGPVFGSSTVCQGEFSVEYSVDPVEGAEGYLWYLPQGASGNSSTHTIQVNFSPQAQSGYVYVRAMNDCGNGPYASKFINVTHLVGSTGLITGPDEVCQGESNVTYSIEPIPYASGYMWTLPDGTGITSNVPWITLSFGAEDVSGTLGVRGYNDCGEGIPSQLPVTVHPFPGTAGPVTGDTLVCQASSGLYQIEPVEYAETYQWMLPFGMGGSSTSHQIHVSFDSAMVCGLITVKGVNGCGQGAESVKPVCIQPIPVIPQQPVPDVVEFSQMASFEIPYRPGMNYQWQTISRSQEGWMNLTDSEMYLGAITHALTVLSPIPSMNENQYRCKVSTTCYPPAISQTVRLYVVPPGWMMAVSTGYHLIHIPLVTHPEIDNQPIQPGDYIGVFFEEAGEFHCAGSARWNGNQTTTIRAYGDDPDTPEKEGFQPGDTFHWKIYVMAGAEELDATATYLYGPNVYSEGLQSTLSALEAYHLLDHTIHIPAGWSGISSFLAPVSDSVEVMFDPLVGQLEILLDMEHIYWPDQDLNTLITWNPASGYLIKTDPDVLFTISGYNSVNKTITLQEGWNLVPVVSSVTVPILETGLFSDLGSSFIMAKDIAGEAVYWPSMGITTLEVLQPGKAYLIRVTGPCTLLFP